MVEMDGNLRQGVHVKFAGPIAAAREVNGQELPVGSATIEDGALETSFKALPAAHVCAAARRGSGNHERCELAAGCIEV